MFGLAALAGCGASSSATTVAASPAAATTSHAVTSHAVTSHAITSTRSGTSRSAAGVAIDRRIAGDAQLRLTDFPSGWTSSPRPAASAGAKCPGIRGAKAAVSARQASPEFVRGSATTADSAAYIYADTATATHWFARLSSRATRTCLVRALRESVTAQIRGQGAHLGSITSRPLTITAAGDEHAADRIVVRLSAGTFSGKAEADVIFVRVERSVAAFAVNQVGGPFDQALETRLVRAVTERLAAGLRGTS